MDGWQRLSDLGKGMVAVFYLEFPTTQPGAAWSRRAPTRPYPRDLLKPGFAVGKVLFARILQEFGFQSGDDTPGIGFGTLVVAGYEDHAVVPWAARHNSFVVQRPEVTKVIGYDGSMFATGESHDLGVR